jgi:hypothetical protein
MDFAKMGQNLGQSLTGNISKAILCIRKVEKVTPVKKGDKKEGADDLSPAEKKTIEDLSGKNGLNAKLMQRAQKTLDNGKTASYDDIKTDAGSKNFLAIEVQYNPTSLRLDTTAGRQMSYSGGAGSTQVQQYTPPASTTLSCELLFDDCNTMDAFMLAENPLTGATPSNLIKTGTSIATNMKDGYSVQRQMEGLLSLLTVPEARHVIFYWGAMCFRGEMTEVSTKYTMFNKKGYPIRGTVGIQIRQGDGSAEAVDPDAAYKYDETYWLNSFDKTFTAEGAGASTFSKATNNSFLNLKL